MKLFCEDCDCWEQNKHRPNIGKCRLNPPTVFLNEYKNAISVFPTTEKESYCFSGRPNAAMRMKIRHAMKDN